MFYIVTESIKVSQSYVRTTGRYIFEDEKEAEAFVAAKRAKNGIDNADIEYNIISGEDDA